MIDDAAPEETAAGPCADETIAGMSHGAAGDETEVAPPDSGEVDSQALGAYIAGHAAGARAAAARGQTTQLVGPALSGATTASPHAADAPTVVVPPPTVAAAELAWSLDDGSADADAAGDDDTGRRDNWRVAVLGAAAIVVLCGVAAILITALPDKPPAPPTPSTTHAAAAPTTKPPPDDSEYVATAISPRALRSKSLHNGGFGAGAGGTQQEADNVALAECRANVTYADDCLLVNAGMYHGCISVAVDDSWTTWNVGTAPNPSEADTDALQRLGVPGRVVSVQCSDPPGWLTTPPPAPPLSPPATSTGAPASAAAPPPPPPTTVTVQAAPTPPPVESTDDQFLATLRRQQLVIKNVPSVLSAAHSVCTQFAQGATHTDVLDDIQGRAHDVTPIGVADFVNDAIAFYCPQYAGR